MHRRRLCPARAWILLAGCGLSLIGLLLAGSSFVAAAPPSAEQQAKIKAAQVAITKAVNLHTAKKFADSAAAVEEAQKTLVELATGADKDLQKAIEPLWARLKTAHSLLELEGVKVVPLEIPPAAFEPPKGTTPATPPVTPPKGTPPAVPAVPAPAGGKISFMKQVFPLMVTKCGGCHYNQSKGGLNFSTFAGLEKGNQAGRVIIPGKGQGSRIYEVIESGDMPRGGGKVAKPELDLIVKWIDEGAVFDGPSKTDKLAIGTAVPEMPAAKLELAKATGKETVSFSKDIAPVLVANCTGCHGAMQASGMLNLDAFDTLLKGGESGPPFKPANSAESLIVRKLKGTAGKRMPLNKPALPGDVIAKFEKWVTEGGKFDGPLSAGEKLERLVAVVKAQAATHEELLKERMTRAERVWKATFPDTTAEKLETKNFFVIGAASDASIKDVADAAEKQAENVVKMLHAPAEGPLVKGRITIFVCKNRVDLEEFLQVNDKKQNAPDARGVWKFDFVEAYAVILPSKDYGLNALLAQEISAVYTAAAGAAPMWFADGVGRTMAQRVDPKDSRVLAFEGQLSNALSQYKGESVVNGGIPRDALGALSYGLVKAQFMTNATNFAALMSALRQGQDFDQAVTKVYRASPLQIATAWGGKKGK